MEFLTDTGFIFVVAIIAFLVVLGAYKYVKDWFPWT